VRFASLDGSREILEPRFTTLPSRPHRLTFTADGALVYSRFVTRGAATYGELFRLENGLERQLTTQARARDAIADGNCILYIASHLEQSTLRRRCDVRDDAVYTPPEGWQLFHPTVNAQGEIALTVWRPGGFLDIAVLRAAERMTADRVAPDSPALSRQKRASGEGRRRGSATESRRIQNGVSSTLYFVTSDFAQDQFPTWLPDGRLVYSSDRSGIAQLWLARVGARASQPVTSSAGGALGNAVSPSGALTFAGFTGVGTETRILPAWTPGQPQPLEFSDPRALDNLRGEAYAIEPYQPNLLPVFWTPFTTNGPGATVVGADEAGVHVYQFAVGYDLFTGTGFNARADYSFAPALDYSLFAGAGFSQAFGWNSSLGASFAGRGESQVTGRFGYNVTPYLSLDDGAFTLGMSLRFDALALDAFGYLRFGWRWTLALDSSGGFSSALTLADLVRGQPVALAVGVSARGASEPRFTLQLQTHDSLDIHWRYPDGFVGLERLTLVPFATLEWQAGAALYGVGAQLMFDLTVNYYVPLSLGLEASWQSGNGFRFRFVTLVPLLDGLRSIP
jgi:WD40-like Beta Propeller Repeat